MTPRNGIRIDPDRLLHEVTRRGLTMAKFAEESQVGEVTLSRAKHGQPVTPGTLRKIARALDRLPVLPAASILPELATGAPNSWDRLRRADYLKTIDGEMYRGDFILHWTSAEPFMWFEVSTGRGIGARHVVFATFPEEAKPS